MNPEWLAEWFSMIFTRKIGSKYGQNQKNVLLIYSTSSNLFHNQKRCGIYSGEYKFLVFSLNEKHALSILPKRNQ